MKTDARERQSVEFFEICKETEISAPIDIAFEAVLDVLGPEGQMPGGKPFPMKIEAWPEHPRTGDHGRRASPARGICSRPGLLTYRAPLHEGIDRCPFNVCHVRSDPTPAFFIASLCARPVEFGSGSLLLAGRANRNVLFCEDSVKTA
jgi:hypothetical protein